MPGSAIAARADDRKMNERPARRPAASPPTAEPIALVLLALAAGCVDGVSFLGLGQVLTAAMTGNTVLFGLALGQADVQAAFRSGVALLGFFAGVMIGASIVGPRVAEGAARWTEVRLLLIAATGLAMGIESAVAHRIAVAGIPTAAMASSSTLADLVGQARWPPAALALPILIVAAVALGAALGRRHAAAR